MASWLYQMTTNDEDPWGPNEYRLDVWQGDSITWPVGNVKVRGMSDIRAGDVIVLFFAKSGTAEPGIYGWGVITNLVRGKSRQRIKFKVTPPSDFLKMSVCWDLELEKLVDSIRGGFKQGTMWAIKPEEFEEIKRKINRHIATI
jgi:hypothetical protein